MIRLSRLGRRIRAAGRHNCQRPGKAELLWYSQAAFKLTTPGGKVIRSTPIPGDEDPPVQDLSRSARST